MIKQAKQLAIFGLGVLLTLNSHASSRDGIYFGAGVGGIQDNYDFTVNNAKTGSFKSIKDNTNGLGNLFLGYGNTTDAGFYVAGELGTYFPRRSTTINTHVPGVANFSDQLHAQDYAVLDILPGYRFNEVWLAYGRAGLSYSSLSVDQAATANFPALSNSENKIGGRIGAGINFAWNSNWGFGVDYTHTIYAEMNSRYFAYNTYLSQKLASNYIGISAFYTIAG